jgi:mannose-1-phosphate guanylyltransferase
MLAIILVGGEGTRLRPLTFTTPKQMLPVVGKPLITRVLEGLAVHGVTDAVLSLGYKADVFIAAFPESEAGGVRLRYAVESEPLDTAGAVRFAAGEAGVTERFIVVNGDVLTDLDVGALIELHAARGAEATIALTPVADPSAFGIVVCDEDGRALDFVEKPPPERDIGNLANAGTYVLEPSVLDRIEPARRVSIERETFPAIAADRALYAVASDAYWLDTGTPAKYIEAQLDIVAGRRPALLPPHGVEEERIDGVFIGKGAEVDGDVVGPASVGAGATIGKGASVGSSVLYEAVAVGEGARIEGSVLLPGAAVEKGAVVECSIVGPGACVGPDAHLSGGSVVGADAEVPAAAVLVGERFPAAGPAPA